MKRQLIFFLVLVNLNLIAQIGPRSWQDHIGNRNCNSLTYFNDKIYASNYSGILISDITFDNVINNKEITTDKLNKINGLSDVGIKLLRANPDRTKLMVFYENSNIDIIDLGNNVVNYPYLKLKIVNGKKDYK